MAVLTLKDRVNKIWRNLGSIHLTVVLCLSLAADLTRGHICLIRNTALFAPLNEIGLTTWLSTYGRHNIAATAWFYLLLGLLTLLGINTFVCTTDRVLRLWALRANITRQRLVLKFAPHVMHYAILIILTGYLCSYLFAQVVGHQTLISGRSVSLPYTTAEISLAAFEPEYYQGDRLPSFKNRVLVPKARLQLRDGETVHTAQLTASRPVRFKGYVIFLKDFAPKLKEGGMNRRVRVDVTLRKDPGVKLYLAGILLFIAGMAMYLPQWILLKPAKKDVA